MIYTTIVLCTFSSGEYTRENVYTINVCGAWRLCVRAARPYSVHVLYERITHTYCFMCDTPEKMTFFHMSQTNTRRCITKYNIIPSYKKILNNYEDKTVIEGGVV